MGIVAYRDGGAAAVGLVGLLRMVPSAICAPLLSPYANRSRRERILVLVSTVRGIVTGYTPSAAEATTGVDELLDRYDPEGPDADPSPSDS